MKATLIFCEGAHDVVFIQRSLAIHHQCERHKEPIAKLPSPFGPQGTQEGLIKQALLEYAIDDLALPYANKPSPPIFESVMKHKELEHFYFLIRTHGKDDYKPVLKLLENAHLAVSASSNFDIKSLDYAFFYDADDKGVDSTLTEFQERYRSFFGSLETVQNAQWQDTAKGSVGCFVFCDKNNNGTLDDHLTTMAQQMWPNRYPGANQYLDDHRNPADEVHKNPAKKIKAAITICGQFDKPGSPMSTMLGFNVFERKHFENSPASRELAAFLANPPRATE